VWTCWLSAAEQTRPCPPWERVRWARRYRHLQLVVEAGRLRQRDAAAHGAAAPPQDALCQLLYRRKLAERGHAVQQAGRCRGGRLRDSAGGELSPQGLPPGGCRDSACGGVNHHHDQPFSPAACMPTEHRATHESWHRDIARKQLCEEPLRLRHSM
jgi:hypothetical protein